MNDLRSIKRSLICIVVLLCIATLYLARDMLLPIAIATLVYLTLQPVIRVAARLGLPIPLAAGGLIFGIVITMVVGGYLLSAPVSEFIAEAPEISAALKGKLQDLTQSLARVQEATSAVEDLAEGTSETISVSVEQPSFIAFAASGLANFSSLAMVGLVLALFMLATGPTLLQKVVSLASSEQDKARVRAAALDIEAQISRYFLTITLINAGLGIVVAAGLHVIGLGNAYIWGLIAFSFNFLPFIGALVGAGLLAIYSIVEFDSLAFAFLPPAYYLFCTSLEGQLITPTVLGKNLEINTVAVCLAVILWTWLWGLPGALMAVPLLVIFKSVADHVPSLNGCSTLLGTR